MPSFITLINYTDQGIKNARDALKRADAAREGAKKFGITLKDMYWTMGAYDVVATWEAPDGPTMSAFVLSTGGQGNVRGQTMRAYSREEMAGIIKKMG